MSKAKKQAKGKPMLSLIPREALEMSAEALEYGIKKYGRYNFKKGMRWTLSIDAALRHIVKFNSGEDFDSESGVHHIGCAIANLDILAFNIKNHKNNDDR